MANYFLKDGDDGLVFPDIDEGKLWGNHLQRLAKI